ncbi:hypothetical protein [Clostridium taeniosporum]|uniref:SGNH/GDSL hydrolase family protein n=1 Tax=Clostridium taeniosporum TaxID=394958 RepID=A0A1D7XIR8_9CLOT|nr:hypothetical protein [Clostridium taeniosporum]AOR23080.1 hypothetical protein BGI42_04805 [Clostridium taeniosporum]
MIKKFLVKGFTLIFIIVFILSILSPIFKHPGHLEKLTEGLYNKEKQYDVLLLGSSHMNGSVDPKVLYDECGITSFNYATGGQPIDVTYYLLKEALKTQKNVDIVILDLYYLGLENEYGEEAYIRNVLDNMKFSYNKLQAIFNCTPPQEYIYYIFPIFKYHNRWGDLKEYDFTKYNIQDNSDINGFDAGNKKYGYDIEGIQKNNIIGEIPDKTKYYLYKFIELSKEKKFSLIFTNAPYDYSSNDFKGWYKDDAAMFNKVATISKENNIPFINYSLPEKMHEINFDFKEDMNNIGHTNIWGANKVSLHLAKFLKENYKNIIKNRDIRNSS